MRELTEIIKRVNACNRQVNVWRVPFSKVMIAEDDLLYYCDGKMAFCIKYSGNCHAGLIPLDKKIVIVDAEAMTYFLDAPEKKGNSGMKNGSADAPLNGKILLDVAKKSLADFGANSLPISDKIPYVRNKNARGKVLDDSTYLRVFRCEHDDNRVGKSCLLDSAHLEFIEWLTESEVVEVMPKYIYPGTKDQAVHCVNVLAEGEAGKALVIAGTYNNSEFTGWRNENE